MQQTTNYKLNKPGMDDTFAVAPLNENADKLDGALAALNGRVAAADAKHCLFRLPDPEVVPSGSGCSMDLSGMGIGQYDALIMTYYIKTSQSSVSVRINDLSAAITLTEPNRSSGGCGGAGVALFMPFDGVIYCLTYSCGYGGIGTRGGALTLPWADIATFTTSSGGMNNNEFHFMGLKM